MPLPGIHRDAVVVTRAQQTADAEGNVVGTLTQIALASGTLGTPQARDQQIAAQRGQIINAVLAIDTAVDIRIGDRVTARARNYTVVDVEDVRYHQRVFLRGQQ